MWSAGGTGCIAIKLTDSTFTWPEAQGSVPTVSCMGRGAAGTHVDNNNNNKEIPAYTMFTTTTTTTNYPLHRSALLIVATFTWPEAQGPVSTV